MLTLCDSMHLYMSAEDLHRILTIKRILFYQQAAPWFGKQGTGVKVHSYKCSWIFALSRRKRNNFPGTLHQLQAKAQTIKFYGKASVQTNCNYAMASPK